jgi:uncharacterized protein (TIGR02246 family)
MRSSIRVRNFSLVLVAVVACVVCASARQQGGGDEAAVRENVRQLESGWNAKSGASFAKPFADDADYVVINGMQIKGRAGIAEGHQGIFDTIYKDSTLNLSVKQVRFIRPEVAVVHVAAHLKATQNGETQEGDAVITLVMTKDKGEWKIAAFQNTGVAAGQRH